MDKKHNIFIGIESFFSTWALIRVFRLGPGNLLSVLIFAGCFLFFKYVTGLYISVGKPPIEADLPKSKAIGVPADLKEAARRRSLICSRIFGLIFALFYFLYDRDNYIEDLTNKGFRAIMLLAVLAGLYFLFMHVLALCICFWVKRTLLKDCFSELPATQIRHLTDMIQTWMKRHLKKKG